LNPVAGNAVFLFPNPLNNVASYFAESLKVLSAGGVIRQEVDLRSTGKVFGPLFET
jgi:hypothetical protein